MEGAICEDAALQSFYLAEWSSINPRGNGVMVVGWSLRVVRMVGNPMSFERTNALCEPWVISKVLYGGIVIPTLIKTVTFTYIIIDIYIIVIICLFVETIGLSTNKQSTINYICLYINIYMFFDIYINICSLIYIV